MDPNRAEAYVYKRFRYPLSQVLGQLFFDAIKNKKVEKLKEAKKWLKEQEDVDTTQVSTQFVVLLKSTQLNSTSKTTEARMVHVYH